MLKPALQDDAFLADVAAARADENALHLWWLGQSGFLLQWRGRHLLFDPYLSDALTTKYANTDKPHVRMTERVIAPHKLTFVDVVTSTHNHTDHLDAQTLRPILASNPKAKLVIPEANRAVVAERLQIDPAFPVGIDIGQTKQIDEFTFTAVPAAHETLDPGFVGYVVRVGPWTVYHSGDTLVYDGMVERLRPHPVDLALLPINGKVGNMDGVDAARLAHAIGARRVVPCHFEMFAFNTASPDAFVAECRRLGQGFTVLKNGSRLTLPGEPKR
jgi:L-ascorbate metabolism protein UlaG (beta-lactamase superfamily)